MSHFVNVLKLFFICIKLTFDGYSFVDKHHEKIKSVFKLWKYCDDMERGK